MEEEANQAAWTLLDVLTLAAIFVGPISAILISQFIDWRRAVLARRMEIFRTLMRTRRTPMWPEHVGALNLVEIEFAKDLIVIAAWKELFKHLGTIHPRRADEEVSESMPLQERGTRNRRFEERMNTERHELLAILLHAIAKAIGFKAEQLEIFKGGYTPQAYVNTELEQQIIRRYIVDLAFGHRVVPVAVVDYRPSTLQSPQEVVGELSEKTDSGLETGQS